MTSLPEGEGAACEHILVSIYFPPDQEIGIYLCYALTQED